MKTYQKVLMGVGAATVVAGVTVVAVRYNMVKEQEEQLENSAKGKIAACSNKVKNKIAGVEEPKVCPMKTFVRRLAKALGLKNCKCCKTSA